MTITSQSLLWKRLTGIFISFLSPFRRRMFVVCSMEDSICILPSYFGREGECAEIEVNRKYCNKVLRDVGLIISVYSIDFIDTGFVFTGQGSCYSKVQFKLVAFLPVVGQIITGTIKEIDDKSVTVGLEFFDDIIIPHTELRDPSHYDPTYKTWYWAYSTGEDEVHKLFYEIGKEIRVRVKSIEFTSDQTLNLEKSAYRPPLLIHASVADDGLGLTSWW